MFIKATVLNSFAHGGEALATIRWIMNEALIVHHLVNRVFEVVLPDELIVIEERKGEAVGHDDPAQASIDKLTKMRRLASICQGRSLALLAQPGYALLRQIEMGLHHV